MAVNLEKGQKVSLEKEAGKRLSKVMMGLGWDPVKRKGLMGLFGGGKEADFDASCLLFGADKRLVDSVWYKQLASKDGSVVHTGDNRTGAGGGDDEQIVVDLSRVPQEVVALVFTVTSYSGQKFSQVANAYCRLVDDGGTEVAKFSLSGGAERTGMVMAKLYRAGGEWKMHAIGEPGDGRSYHDLVALAADLLS